jgi:hypothetical protein
VGNAVGALSIPGISVELVELAASIVRTEHQLPQTGERANPGLFGHRVLDVLRTGEAAAKLERWRQRKAELAAQQRRGGA